MDTNYNNAIDIPKETGVKEVDSVIEKTLEFEKSHLGNPIVQFVILGLAVYGGFKLISK